MHSRRRQEVKPRRSRDADIPSHIENMDKTLGTSENEILGQNVENVMYRGSHYGENSMEHQNGLKWPIWLSYVVKF